MSYNVKKVKCNHCGFVVEYIDKSSNQCTCGKVKVNSGSITEGVCGSDYIDVSQVLILGSAANDSQALLLG